MRWCVSPGLAALAQYHKEWDEETRAFAIKPAHDWSSHGADAFGHLAIGLQDPEAGSLSDAGGDGLRSVCESVRCGDVSAGDPHAGRGADPWEPQPTGPWDPYGR